MTFASLDAFVDVYKQTFNPTCSFELKESDLFVVKVEESKSEATRQFY